MTSHTVKFGSVSLTLSPWKHASGEMHWRAPYYENGKRKHLTRAKLADAKAAALEKAIELSKGTVDINALPPHVIRQIRRMLDVDPQLALVDEFLLWKTKTRPEKLISEAVTEFVALKEANAGLSTQNVRTLRKHLNPFAVMFGSKFLSSITVTNVEDYLASNPSNGNRTRKNIRASIVTFFRWCQSREYLPEGKTAAEKSATPIVSDSIPDTYTPEELRTLLAQVRPEFLPWLATAAFAGVRTDEICPVAGSRKSPLDWSDFKWDRDLIIIRPETAKTKRRRVVPILPALRSWLYPCRKESGPIHATIAPTRSDGKKVRSETSRLGNLIGGWKPNALRASFISYRAATEGLGVTAMEAGNSEAEAKKSYNDAMGKDEAEKWFGVQHPSPP